jgi:hypothetical protein
MAYFVLATQNPVGLTPRAGSSPAFGTKIILKTKRIFALLKQQNVLSFLLS